MTAKKIKNMQGLTNVLKDIYVRAEAASTYEDGYNVYCSSVVTLIETLKEMKKHYIGTLLSQFVIWGVLDVLWVKAGFSSHLPLMLYGLFVVIYTIFFLYLMYL